MSLDDTIDAIWTAHQGGEHFPPAWLGKLDMEQAYRVQHGLMERRLADGGGQAGWKIGLSAPALRELFGATAPVYGYLLAAGGHPSGHAFRTADIPNPGLESELMLELGQALKGPGVTADQVRAAVTSVRPAFEIISRRGGDMKTDMGLALADNVMHAAYVMGDPVPFDPAMELGDVRAEVFANGEVAAAAVCREAMDHPLESVAWLANSLAALGLGVAAGHKVLTGSFNKPVPINPGDRFETRFAGVGTVNASFT